MGGEQYNDRSCALVQIYLEQSSSWVLWEFLPLIQGVLLVSASVLSQLPFHCIHNFISELCDAEIPNVQIKLKPRDIKYSTEVLTSVSYIGMITGDNNLTHFDSFLCHLDTQSVTNFFYAIFINLPVLHSLPLLSFPIFHHHFCSSTSSVWEFLCITTNSCYF